MTEWRGWKGRGLFEKENGPDGNGQGGPLTWVQRVLRKWIHHNPSNQLRSGLGR